MRHFRIVMLAFALASFLFVSTIPHRALAQDATPSAPIEPATPAERQIIPSLYLPTIRSIPFLAKGENDNWAKFASGGVAYRHVAGDWTQSDNLDVTRIPQWSLETTLLTCLSGDCPTFNQIMQDFMDSEDTEISIPISLLMSDIGWAVEGSVPPEVPLSFNNSLAEWGRHNVDFRFNVHDGYPFRGLTEKAGTRTPRSVFWTGQLTVAVKFITVRKESDGVLRYYLAVTHIGRDGVLMPEYAAAMGTYILIYAGDIYNGNASWQMALKSNIESNQGMEGTTIVLGDFGLTPQQVGDAASNGLIGGILIYAVYLASSAGLALQGLSMFLNPEECGYWHPQYVPDDKSEFFCLDSWQ